MTDFSDRVVNVDLNWVNVFINKRMDSFRENIKILVIGDIMLDHYIYGDCNRISPEAPVQIVEVKKEQFTLGGAGNVLKNLKALNCEAGIIAVTGKDRNAQIVTEQLKDIGITVHHILNDNMRCTTVKSRVVVSNHQLIRLDKEDKDPVNDVITKKLIDIIEQEVSRYDIVLISDYDKGLLTPELLNSIFRICRTKVIRTIVDPKGSDFSKYKGATVIKPNKKEAIIASGIIIKDEESLKEACIKIRDITGCDDVVVTMSEDGIALYSDGKLKQIATRAQDIIDVTGAGDTVLASIGLILASGHSIFEACNFANHAAAVVVNKVGSATATINEINQTFIK